ncbi:helix-turn-helix domain-containing protein [Pedobacter alpinus]|uniref:Helix-turn-helix domain-containing protein n=1 Tax=Pedobacter alpinus TaxID=1590643 RepID=A0ABW5TTF8_9SPHI
MNLNYFVAPNEDVAHVITLLSNYYPISDSLAAEFKTHAITVSLKKDQHLLHQGEVCKYMYFIKEGAMMAYSDHHHKKITTYISIENEFLSSLTGLYGEQPSKKAIVAIEPTILLGVHTDILLGWYERFFELNYMIRKVYESYYIDAQERSHIVRVGKAKERYENFVHSRSGDVDRLPIECVASFLDMKPETLSRIKKDIAEQTDSGDIEDVFFTIENFIKSDEIFKDKTITLLKFSKKIGINQKKIKEVLSLKHKLNFSDWINQYRVNYFKQLISKNQNLQNLTIEGLAFQAGFKSRSGFYKIFQKHEGVSPKAYIEEIK